MFTHLERHNNETESEVNVKRLRGRSIMFKPPSGMISSGNLDLDNFADVNIQSMSLHPCMLDLRCVFSSHSVILAS